MELRKFYATSVEEAMELVRTACGEDAIILDTRTIQEPASGDAPAAERVEIWVQCATIAPAVPAVSPGTEPETAISEPVSLPAATAVIEPDAESTVDDDLADEVRDLQQQLGAVHQQLDQLTDGMGWMGAGLLDSTGELTECIAESLAGKMPYSGGIRPCEGEQHLVAFVGPTGVGKTTMIAKLAWRFSVLEGRSVGIITTDTVRIGAVEQTTRYCRHLDIPVEVVYTPEQLPGALERLAGCSLILIDTPGGSQRNPEYLCELHALLSAADPMEVHLVMSAGVSLPVARDIMRRYGDVQPDQVILTKLDEAPLCLEWLPILFGSGMALSYFSAGQQVDGHCEVASADVLFRFLTNP